MNDFGRPLYSMCIRPPERPPGRRDPDGLYRIVISVADPGVPNWLDPVGNAKGLICARCSNRVAPEVALKKVRLAQLRNHFASGYPGSHRSIERIAALTYAGTVRRFREIERPRGRHANRRTART